MNVLIVDYNLSLKGLLIENSLISSLRRISWTLTQNIYYVRTNSTMIICTYLNSSVAVWKLLLNYLRPNSTKQRVFIWWFIQHFSSKDLELDELWNFEKYWKLLVLVVENIDHPATRHSSAIVSLMVWVFWISMPSITEKIIRMFWVIIKVWTLVRQNERNFG